MNDDNTKVRVRPAIAQMVSNMLRYNIPPQFNFLKYNDKAGKYISPFAMYLFPFDVTLSQKDLERIWQNTTPDIGLDFGFGNNPREQVLQEVKISHDLFGIDDFLDPKADVVIRERSEAVARATDGRTQTFSVKNWDGGINKELQWMVFKVKQKAETSFFRKKELDRLPTGHPEKVISVENDKYRYGFNWPYDYFSLVELINLDAEVAFSYKRTKIREREARELLIRNKEE